MKKLEPLDIHYLRAAEGWLEFGNCAEANEELGRIAPENQGHPGVLLLRWLVCAKLKQWGVCIELARSVTRASPEIDQGWINLANSLYFNGQTQEAYDCIKPMLERFPENSTLPYNLACYACQLGRMEEAMDCLRQAIAQAGAKRIKSLALADKDLEPLWKSIREM